MSVAAIGFTPCDNWTMQIRVENGRLSQGTMSIGTSVGATDGYDLGFDFAYSMTYSGVGEIICTDLPANEDYPGGRWYEDIRKPLRIGDCTIWNLRAYINGVDSGTFTLKAWMMSNGKLTTPDMFIGLYDGTMSFQQFWTLQSLWHVPCNQSGSSSNPQYTGMFSYIGGYRAFTLIAYIEPEPGSMSVLICGLTSFTAIAWRRRR